jgi:protein-S-isoprenylcysteine O-methyltransferase Ste14
MFAIVVAGVAGPAWPDETAWLLRFIGIPIAIVGAVLFMGGMVGIRRSLTPFPRPLERARLQVAGVYGLVRHPIYGGLILIGLGWSLASSPQALAMTAALLVVLEAKSRLEESMLEQRFPGYGAYRGRVRRRFIPGIH